MSIKIDPLIGSVQVLHNEIETVFTQTPIATQALKNIEMLLANTFSMIGITGKKINYDDVMAMFSRNAGKRPELRIETDSYNIIYQSEHWATVNYRETHYENKKILTRQSVVVLRRTSLDCQWQWYYLHETPVLDN
ncbi:hypothetical protein [Proteus mirabilis]|uniref:hypothetical protein n=1 Tax=Proteus mirabilis TaxID=584 RepID=UPI003314A0E2